MLTSLVLAAAASGTDLEEVSVVGTRYHAEGSTTHIALDAGSALKQHAGVNANGNGPLTSILQIRGVSGDRVRVNIDGLAPATGGPNAMDSPLSYAIPAFVVRTHHYRGIAPVSAGAEALGGAVDIERAYPAGGGLQGRLALQAGSDAQQMAAFQGSVGSEGSYLGTRLLLSSGDDLSFGGGDIVATRHDRNTAEVFGATEALGWQWRGSYVELETSDTGTPVLPMDIGLIDSEQWRLGAQRETSAGAFRIRYARQDIFHAMDNFSLRQNADPMRHRLTAANGAMQDLALEWQHGYWHAGVSQRASEHDANITNPNNPMFRVENFQAVERKRNSAFAELTPELGGVQWQLGARYSRVSTDAGAASAAMPMMMGGDMLMMPMMDMQAMVDMLSMQFTQSSRDRSFNLLDLVAEGQINLSGSQRLTFGGSQKERAPSYQELYLWIPMEATGGLGDGYTYIGDTRLRNESQRELLAGWHYQKDAVAVYVTAFWREIEDYIQGTPSGNETANRVATMMGGKAPLQFANTDARLRGLEVEYRQQFNDSLQASARISYVRGDSLTLNEPLYRLAPLEGIFDLTYAQDGWQTTLELVARGAQNRTSMINAEQQSNGYALVNARTVYAVSEALSLGLNMTNLADRRYFDHLAGIYRPNGQEIAQGTRMPGYGRQWQLSATYRW